MYKSVYLLTKTNSLMNSICMYDMNNNLGIKHDTCSVGITNAQDEI